MRSTACRTSLKNQFTQHRIPTQLAQGHGRKFRTLELLHDVKKIKKKQYFQHHSCIIM